MTELQERRSELKRLQVHKDNRTAKLDVINKLLKKLRAGQPDMKLAATAADYHLEKFSEEIINIVVGWLELEQSEPIATAVLVHCMFDYEEFAERFKEWASGVLSTGNGLDQAAKKLKLMQLVMELHYAGRKLPIGEFFGLISVQLTDYFVAYYYMLGLVYHFGLYPLKPTSPQLAYRPEDVAAIRKKLLVVRDVSVGLFQKQKQQLYSNHKIYAKKMKKGYVLAAEVEHQKQKERQLIELKKCLENFCGMFDFPCGVEYKPLEPQKEEEVVRDANSGTVPALSEYVLRDFKVLLPGILFEEDVGEHFETEQKIERKHVDLVKKLAEAINYRQTDDIFVQFMEKFTAGQRAVILLYILDTPQALELFDSHRMVTLARFIASFCQYWPGFGEQINSRLKSQIDAYILQKPNGSLHRLLMLYSELLKFDLADNNNFMSVFKNVLEKPREPEYEEFVKNSFDTLNDLQETSQRAKYLLSKSEYAGKIA